MKKNILILCVMLACVAPAMAVDFYEMPGGDTWSGTSANWAGYNYNPTPDQALIDAFNANYVVPFTTWIEAPYYEGQGTSAVPVGANLRQNMITARCDFGAGDVVVANTFAVADSYWPLNYTSLGTTYTVQEFRHNGAGSSVTANTFQIGHDAAEFAIPNGVVIANQGKYNLRVGALDIGDLRMLNEAKIVTTAFGYGLNYYAISNESASSDASSVTIDNIYLNETMLYLHMNAGTWTLGNVGLQNAGEGNAVMMLFGNRTADRSTVLGNGGELVMSFSNLLGIIDNGLLWSKTGTNANRFRPGGEFQFVPVAGSALPVLNTVADAHLITRANMYQELDILDLGNGLVSAVVCTPVNVPEPATMALLGLGALVLRRKR